MRLGRSTFALAAVIIAAAAAPAGAAERPPAVPGARAAIVIDARDGTVMFAKHPDAERAIASTTKLMTALLALERAKPGDVFTAPAYHALPAESRINLREGERMTVHDLLEALLLESANDAAETLAVGISGSREAFVEEMNARAAELGLEHTSYANPIGLDEAGNYSSARDLAKLARALLQRPRFARIVDMPEAELESGARPRVVDNRNDLISAYPWVSGVKTGYTANAGNVLVGSAKGPGGARVISVVLGEPTETARNSETLALLRWGLGRFHRVRVLDPRRMVAQADIEYYDEQRPPGSTARRGRHHSRRPARPAARERARRGEGATDGWRPSRYRDSADRWEAGAARGACHGREGPRSGDIAGAPIVAGDPLDLASSRRHRRRRRACIPQAALPYTDRPMIITVTLNAAIDKTLAVPNFRLGHRHRAVEQTAMAGGKGVNVARALRALGQPVIATGVAGGPTGTRIVEHLTEEGILNDFVRIREESRTSTAVVDPTNGEQTEINEHGPHVTEGELELFVDKLLYLAKGAAVCVVSGSLPRGVGSDLYGRLIEEMKRLDVVTVLDSEGEPMSIGTRKGPAIVSPNELEAEGLVGHEFSDEEDRRTAVGEMVALGAREAIMTMPDGCMAMLNDGGERSLYRATLEPLEPVSSVGSGDAFLAGFVAARYAGRDVEECLRFAVACGAESTQHFGAGVVEQREVERLAPDVRVERLETPALTVG